MSELVISNHITTRQVLLAAAYIIVSEKNGIDVNMRMAYEKENTNIESAEVLENIRSGCDVPFSQLISLHILGKVCEPVIDSTASPIVAIKEVARILKRDYAEFAA